MRADDGYAATGITDDPAGDLIINQYYGQGLNAADVIAAYGRG